MSQQELKSMKRFLAFLPAVSILVAATPVFAADLPVKAPVPAYPATVMNWTGFGVEGFGLYGVNFGGASTQDAGPAVGTGIFDTEIAAHPHGLGLGGGLSYFYQPNTNGLVFGVRAQISYANLQGGASGNIFGGAASLNINNATNYLGNADACLGIPLSSDGRLLGTGCGGFAFGGAKPNLNVFVGPNAIAAAASDTSTGYNLSLGLDYALTPQWIVGIEGSYTKLNNKSLSLVDTAGIVSTPGTTIATSSAQYAIFEQLLKLKYRF
jgi:opacity protein-like surface antigen